MATAYLGILGIEARAAESLVVLTHELLAADWLGALVAHEAPLMECLVLVADFLLAGLELAAARFALLGRSDAAAVVTDQFLLLESEALGELKTRKGKP